MPISDSDPRVFFAAERTLLAWLRTAITVMALGFVIARFGLLLQLISHGRPPADLRFSAVLGIAFVLVGTLTIFIATVQHRRFLSTLPQSDFPRSYSGAFAVAYGILMGFAGLVLAVYLAIAEA